MRLETRVIRILPGPRPLTISTTRVEGLPPTECLNPAGLHDLDDGLPVISAGRFSSVRRQGRTFEYGEKVRQNKIGCDPL